MNASADLHVGDFDFGKILAVPGMAPVAGPARESKDPDLLAFAMPHDFGRDLGAFHARRPVLDVLAVARNQDLIERDFVARLRIEQRDFDRDTGLSAKLTAAGGE